MKVLDAETQPDGSRRFKIEAVPEVPEIPAVLDTKGAIVTPAVPATLALTEEYVWGADVPLDVAQRETRLMLDSKYGKPKPTKIVALIGKDL